MCLARFACGRRLGCGGTGAGTAAVGAEAARRVTNVVQTAKHCGERAKRLSTVRGSGQVVGTIAEINE